MSKYIPAEKLVAEIERRMKDYNASIEKYYDKQKSIKAERDSWKWAECKWFLNLITSLQQEQPEVELEKEIDKGIADYSFTKTIDSGGFKTTVIDYAKIAHHFYELGLKARKEK